jgi:hypothetical protein
MMVKWGINDILWDKYKWRGVEMKSRKAKGAALIWVICISMVLMILGSALLDITVANAKQAADSANKNQANFLARSGVNTGLNMLQQQLYNSNNGIVVPYTDRAALINALNAMASNGADIAVDGAGRFSLRFQDLADGTGNIKIIGVGKSNGSPAAEDTASLTVYLEIPDTSKIHTNPDDWISANGGSLQSMTSQKELSHKVDASNKYLGNMVILNGGNKPVRYNQGGSLGESTYRASVIVFKSYADGTACLKQADNTLNMTIDAEIIYFGDSILSSKGKDVRLTTSDEVLNRPIDGVLPVNPNGESFSSFNRYAAFVKSYYPTISDDTLRTYWNSYGFVDGYNYGIVCYKKSIGNMASNYYFFPSNDTMSLSALYEEDNAAENVLGNNNCIPIDSRDPIINALEMIYNTSGNCSVMYWDNK